MALLAREASIPLSLQSLRALGVKSIFNPQPVQRLTTSYTKEQALNARCWGRNRGKRAHDSVLEGRRCLGSWLTQDQGYRRANQRPLPPKPSMVEPIHLFDPHCWRALWSTSDHSGAERHNRNAVIILHVIIRAEGWRRGKGRVLASLGCPKRHILIGPSLEVLAAWRVDWAKGQFEKGKVRCGSRGRPAVLHVHVGGAWRILGGRSASRSVPGNDHDDPPDVGQIMSAASLNTLPYLTFPYLSLVAGFLAHLTHAFNYP